MYVKLNLKRHAGLMSIWVQKVPVDIGDKHPSALGDIGGGLSHPGSNADNNTNIVQSTEKENDAYEPTGHTAPN